MEIFQLATSSFALFMQLKQGKEEDCQFVIAPKGLKGVNNSKNIFSVPISVCVVQFNCDLIVTVPASGHKLTYTHDE